MLHPLPPTPHSRNRRVGQKNKGPGLAPPGRRFDSGMAYMSSSSRTTNDDIPDECEHRGCEDPPTHVVSFVGPAERVYYCRAHANVKHVEMDTARGISHV